MLGLAIPHAVLEPTAPTLLASRLVKNVGDDEVELRLCASSASFLICMRGKEHQNWCMVIGNAVIVRKG
jgi:hypothetical protein